MDASPPFSVPRLRLPRHSPQFHDQALTPVAGPSHNPDFLHAEDDDEDAESTPRMSASAIPDRQSPRVPISSGLPADNPTARLRALLSRAPNSPNGTASQSATSRPLMLPSSSDTESDFEPPQSTVTASSVARESLKELFSHALRDNTPQKKGRPRRNSIDASEVEASPRVEEARASHRAKRRTLSDEEADKSKHATSSERSFRSSAASTFHALRQRLDRSTSAMPSLPQEQLVMDMSMPPPNSSTDTAMPPVVQVDTSSETPPRATSTPMRTFQLSEHLHMHSNLLDQDSEMQNALQGMDSYESAPIPRQRYNSTPSLKHSAGPTPRPQPSGGPSARPFSWSSHSKSHSVNNLPPVVRRGSEDLDSSSSRASSSLSGADYHERQEDGQRERMHERERGWNSPVPKLPKSPAHPGLTHRNSLGSLSSGRGSPAHRLNRKGSAASLTGTDDGRPSSRASSVASRSDYKERMQELEEERTKEREREWNRPHPKLSRSSSSLSLNKSERVRKISTPSRPDSAASYLSPTTTKTLHKRDSLTSLSSSRPSSPAGSISGASVEIEIEHEIEHQRERNWNSPRPDWGLHARRSLSPLPRSRPGSPVDDSVAHIASTAPRSRRGSFTHGNSLSVPSPIPRSKSPVGDRVTRPKSPMLRSSADNKPSPHARSKSPVPSTPPPEKAEPSTGFHSRFGFKFPNHKPLPPFEREEESPQRPPRPSSRTSLSASATTPSHIPVRSPRKSGHNGTLSTSGLPEKKKSHRRSVTEFTESVGSIPPRIEVSSIDDLPPVPIVDGHDDFSSSASEDDARVTTGTPTAKPVALPPPEVTTTPLSEPPTNALNGHTSQPQDTQPPRSTSPLASPPLTPPSPDSQPTFSLQTPPRRPQFYTPKAEFETPPPPRGLPDLPGPPSTDEEDGGDHTPLMQSRDVLQGDLTAMKTPRPPGAWMATPAPTRQLIKEPVERPSSAPPPDFNSSTSSDSGLATPPSTLSRASTLPAQTPAPPGGWVATPAPAPSARRRGSILKVRFDLESETASEGAVERPAAGDSVESKDSGAEPQNADSSAAGASVNGDASAASSALPDESSVGPPPTPPSLRNRIRKKSPGIRVLDAYGREQVETEAVPEPPVEPPLERKEAPVSDHRATVPSTPRNDARPASSATPRSRSVVRVVDAMGREIEEPAVEEEDSIVSRTPLTHNEAVMRLREQVSSMAHELSDADRSTELAVFDERMYAALQEQCKAAQLARTQIAQTLQRAQRTESELKSKHAPLRGTLGKSALLPIGSAGVQTPWNVLSWRSVAFFVLFQLLLLAAMYRYSVVQARKIFLTTYYDAFYPDLYIHLFKPDTTSHTIPTCPPWSIFAVFSSLQRGSWSGVFADAWASTSCALSRYLQPNWFGWNYAQDTLAHSWPPT